MQAIVKLDNATFQVSFHEGNDEFTGDCMWETKKVHLAQMIDAGMTDRFLVDYNVELEREDDEETTMVSDADSLICFLAAASQADPHTYEIDYHGEAYWFFHDLVHAEYDSGDGSDIYVNEDAEMRALPMGGELAAKHGVPISDILRTLAKIGPEFKDRFGFEFDAVDAFLDRVEVILK